VLDLLNYIVFIRRPVLVAHHHTVLQWWLVCAFVQITGPVGERVK